MSDARSRSLAPPLGFGWRKSLSFSQGLADNDAFYGISSAGKVVCLRATDGTQRWESSGSYLSRFLAKQGNRLFAYRIGDGLVYLDSQGSTVSEHLSVSFPASTRVNLCTPVVDDRLVYLAVNQGLYVDHQDLGLQYAEVLGELTPHNVCLIGPRQVVTINGLGVPSRYAVGATAFVPVWSGESPGTQDGQSLRPYVQSGDKLIVAVGSTLVAYDLNTGRILWRLYNITARSFAADATTIYAATNTSGLWAIASSDGAIRWQRQYLYDMALQLDYGVVLSDGYLFYGTTTGTPDEVLLFAVLASNGQFVWHSRSAAFTWAGGIPVSEGTRLFCYGGSVTGMYLPLSSTPRVTTDMIFVTPRPLRGPSSQFGGGSISIELPVPARVTVAPYRERQGVGSPILSDVNWTAGHHETSWTPAGTGGFSDQNQFGYVLFDIQEAAGSSYTQPVLVPVNTFPDIQTHWARVNIEIMVFNQFLSGYEDMTFRPDNLVTRAESSTIIAKTLGLQGPSGGFQTKFTDLAGHWARPFILALEERGVVGGFLEPDGTYTFRPDESMTRAQEARILVRAYAIPQAPPGFSTRFTDVSGHWAEPDIKALEAARYVNGFQEADGSFTYRPEQNLTRAELCTIVVRIRRLTR